MRPVVVAAVAVLIVTAGCTGMRVEGVVTDSVTAEPVGTCQITIGGKYIHTDPAGRYEVKVRRVQGHARGTRVLRLTCKGYETKGVAVSPTDRYQTVNVEVDPTGR